MKTVRQMPDHFFICMFFYPNRIVPIPANTDISKIEKIFI
jgi:hypothetical protein